MIKKSSLLLSLCLATTIFLASASYPLGETNPLFLDETYHKGFIQLGDRGSLFYWLFDSRDSPSTDPLIIWLQGGPGCASVNDAFWTNGPFNLDAVTGEVSKNPFSWNTKANLLYVDQPRGTGFSTGNTFVENMEQLAEDFHSFLADFLERLPQFKGRDVYITGQSYSGHYIPAIGKFIHQKGDLDINFLGIAVGNGWFAKEYQELSYADYALANGLINQATYIEYRERLEVCVQAIKDGNYELADEYATCWEAQDIYISPVLPNWYDIRKNAEDDDSFVVNFLNRPDVQAALGTTGRVFEKCNGDVWNGLYWDEYIGFTEEFSYLIRNGLKVLQYHGVYDFICNWMGGENFSNHLDWRGNCKFKYSKYVPWKDYGEYRQLDNFVFLKVFNAGHMVPHDQPKVALEMLQKWIGGW